MSHLTEHSEAASYLRNSSSRSFQKAGFGIEVAYCDFSVRRHRFGQSRRNYLERFVVTAQFHRRIGNLIPSHFFRLDSMVLPGDDISKICLRYSARAVRSGVLYSILAIPIPERLRAMSSGSSPMIFSDGSLDLVAF